ncbi:uncharacterized protein EAE97_007489 [Botrytis byssoidea]|uniref:HhH-GPD domain-containing protein n=1 Tax=Botrytis byssoidea TaxID=139641 RepID=A0A9P5II92_9HELO|nr:uncharacterized protein EAE97_007489 [Botrytis byssoidea]KAF7939409.1 hypothetical protein EAE97_007489 [Botrytis byssoidea]
MPADPDFVQPTSGHIRHAIKAQLPSRKKRRIVTPGSIESTEFDEPVSSSYDCPSDSSDFDDKRLSKRPKRSNQARASRSAIITQQAQVVLMSEDSKRLSATVPATSKTPQKSKYDYSSNALSPFPNWPAPTPEMVEMVFRLLEDKHGKIEISQSKPSLGLRIEGCNQDEPALIDAVIRARLSAGTNDMNASRAFMSILTTFGRLKPGTGPGIVDWEAVRLAPLEKLYEAIKTGGMGNVKSRSCKAILDMVYEENVIRRQRGEVPTNSRGIDLLSLEHMRSLSKDEAFDKFITFPGVGPKTAACIISICMQHNAFAVDTHVYRICTWLGWVPPGTSRDGMFAHLETKIPDHLKFDLHYLMIRHGRFCGRCQANTSSTGKKWKEIDCPLEGLVKRTGGRREKQK